MTRLPLLLCFVATALTSRAELTATFRQNVPAPRSATAFGSSIASIGDFMAVTESGRVYLYEHKGGTWDIFDRKNYLVSPGTNAGDFGECVLMPDRNTLIISDPSFDALTPTGGTNSDQGAVYVFGRDIGGDNNWGLIRQITATDHQLPNGNFSKRLGEVMAVSGGRLVVSAAAGTSIGNPKFFYVFEKDRGGNNQWGQVPGVKLEGTDLSLLSYGNTVAVSGDLIVVASALEGYRATPGSAEESGRGAIFLYGRHQGGTDAWGLLPGGRRYAPDGAAADFFGQSISLDGDRMAVGAPGRDLSATQRDAGMVYILAKNEGGPGTWGFTPARISAPDAAQGDSFGSVVKLRGDVLAACATSDDVAGTNNAGSVRLFRKTAGNWGALASGFFSIDNVPGITGINSSLDKQLHLDELRLLFWSRTSSALRAVTDIRLTGFPGPESVGLLSISANGNLGFVPAVNGSFQLQSSPDLESWSPVGSEFAGTAGVPVTVGTGTPGGQGKRFYRIEGR